MLKEKKRFEGCVVHTRDTIRRLYKAAYDTYDMKKVVVRLLVGAALAVLGVLWKGSMITQGILLMIGCWLLVSRDFPSKSKADRVLETRKQTLPTIISSFYDEHLELTGEGQMSISYDKFQYLVEEKGYCFLFLDQNSACMIDQNMLSPAEPDAFKDFISQKTRLDWKKTTSWFNMSLMDLIRSIRN